MPGMRIMLTRFRPPRRRDEEDGAVLAMTAFLTVVIITIAAFAVDLGLQRSAIRDMQSIADAAAMDAARVLPSCDNAKLTTEANKSKQRHGAVIGDDDPLVAFAGHLDAAGKFVAGSKSGGVCDAVRVTSTTTVSRVFAGGDGDAIRSAVGTRGSPEVCFSVGTKTLTLNSSGSALGPILDHILKVKLNVVGYEGLVALKDIQVPLLALAGQLGVGTPQELLNLPNLSLGQLMIATANALPATGNAATISLLKTIGFGLSSVNVSLAKILALSTGSSAGLNADVNALDLIGAAIVAANGTNSLAVNQLGITLPADLVNAQANVVVTEPPQIACGGPGSTARSAQVKLDLSTGVNAVGIAAVQLALGVQVGAGSATLSAVSCSDVGGSPSVTFSPITTAAAEVKGYQGAASALAQVKLLPAQYRNLLTGLLSVLLLPLIGREINLDVGLRGSVGAGTYTSVPPVLYPPAPQLPPVLTRGASEVLKLEVTKVELSKNQGVLTDLLGNLLNPLISVLTSGIVNPLVANVLNPVLSGVLVPVLNLLGIKLGVTEVAMLGRPSCNSVKLVETQG